MKKTVKRIIITGVTFVLIFGGLIKYGDYLNTQEALQNSEVAQEEQLEQLENQMTDEQLDVYRTALDMYEYLEYYDLDPDRIVSVADDGTITYIGDNGETMIIDPSRDRGIDPSEVEGMTEEQKVDYIVDKAREQVQAAPADTSEGYGDKPSEEQLAAAGFTKPAPGETEAALEEDMREHREYMEAWERGEIEHIATGISAGAGMN